jgi:hypothetical protein
VRGILFSIVLMAGAPAAAAADDGEYFPPVRDALTQAECGACHMAFPAGLLPARSWQTVMKDLGNHFGEDASLAPDATAAIEAYLIDNAAPGWAFDGTPMRVTETSYWRREHAGEVPDWAWRDPRVKSKANCEACHPGAGRGVFED